MNFNPGAVAEACARICLQEPVQILRRLSFGSKVDVVGILGPLQLELGHCLRRVQDHWQASAKLFIPLVTSQAPPAGSYATQWTHGLQLDFHLLLWKGV